MTEVLLLSADGAPLRSERDATDLIGDAYAAQAEWIAIPLARLAPDFFDLKNRAAGLFLQKFMNYGFKVAFVGDISAAVAESEALAAFVRESNRGAHVRFVSQAAELNAE